MPGEMRLAIDSEDFFMQQLSIVVYARDAEDGMAMTRALESIPHVRVVGQAKDALASCLEDHAPDAVFASLGSTPHRTLDTIEALPAGRPLFFLWGGGDDASVLLRSTRMGGVQSLESLDPTTVLAALEGLSGPPATEDAPVEPSPKPAGSVLAVMGSKGGVGATVVGCQLAASLRELGGRVALVDLANPLGDVAAHYDVQPSSALANVPAGEAMDAAWLHGALQTHRSGVKVLAGPARAEESERIQAAHVNRLIPLLRGEFDWVVIDLSHAWTDASICALDLADTVLLVTLLDVPTLNHARRRLDLLRRLGHPSEKIRLLGNRDERQNAMSEREISEFLGRVPDARIANDYATVARGINQGRLISEVASKSPLHLAYRDLACEVHGWCGRDEPEIEEASEPSDLVARIKGTFRKRSRPTQARPPSTVPDTGARPYQVVTVTSNKGGVAKTTVATNLAVYFRALREDLPVLVVGFDDQSMIDRMFALETEQPYDDVLGAIRGGSLTSAIRLGQYGVHYVATSPDVSELKGEIDDVYRLREILRETNWKGLVILDTKSDFEILTRNAIAASDMSVVVVHDHTSLLEARKIYDFIDRLGKPRENAQVLLSLVDRRIKFNGGSEEERIDILAHLVREVRAQGYPLFESFISRSPKVEALYTNPFGRAVSILHGAQESLIHVQMSHLARDILDGLDGMKSVSEPTVVAQNDAPLAESAEPATPRQPGAPAPLHAAPARSRGRWGWGRKRASGQD